MRPDRLRDQLEALPVDLLDGLRAAPRSGSVRECDCPPYVSRCAHRGDHRVWFIAQDAGIEEFQRRVAEAGQKVVDGRCPKCGGGGRRPWDCPVIGIVYGPGIFVSEPDCLCATPLNVYDDSMYYKVTSEEELELKFGEASALLAEFAP